MAYYRGSSNYPHPEHPEKRLLYLRNRYGWRVCVNPEDAERLKPFDLFITRQDAVFCKSVLGKQKPIQEVIREGYTLFKHVVQAE